MFALLNRVHIRDMHITRIVEIQKPKQREKRAELLLQNEYIIFGFIWSCRSVKLIRLCPICLNFSFMSATPRRRVTTILAKTHITLWKETPAESIVMGLPLQILSYDG